tara:strand:+ start:98 stop:406 length:309 start_codon:yes stop_codon:yes gene_type:complete
MPNLIEPGVKYFLDETLKNCNKKRIEYNNNLFNILLFLGLFLFVSLFLYYKFKTRPTKNDLEEREKQKKYYILNKIKSLNDKAAKERMEMITNLPKFESINY